MTTIKNVLRGVTTIVSVAGQTEAAADGHHKPEDMKGRWDSVRSSSRMAKSPPPGQSFPTPPRPRSPSLSDDPAEEFELRYTHFGVKYSAAKLPIMTAVNIDGKHSIRIKRENDKWFTDGRIPAEVQLGAANFKDLKIDRGHMVRREDPNWGEDAVAPQANDDTFHYVNAAAQHSRLNQGKTLWQGLENYVLRQQQDQWVSMLRLHRARAWR